MTGKVDDWVVLLPQLGTRGGSRTFPDLGRRSLFSRVRTRGPLFQAISEPKHRHAIRRIAGAVGSYGDDVIENLRQPRRGAVLLYPITEQDLDPPRSDDPVDTREVVVALTLVAPADAVTGSGQLVQFVARNRKLEKAPIIDVDAAD